MKKIKISKKIILVLTTALVFGGFSAFFILNKNQENKTSQNEPQTIQESISYSPPTEEEIKSANDNKQENDALEEDIRNQNQSPVSGKRQASPIITSAAMYGDSAEVSSYITGIFEDGGTCTAHFKRNNLSATQVVTATKEGRSTYCPLFRISKNQLTESGVWSVTVSYESAAYRGTSEPVSIEVK